MFDFVWRCSSPKITQEVFLGVCTGFPLWGKCYVGGCGYTRSRCPLERWVEHMRQAKLSSSATSCSRFRPGKFPLYAAMVAVSLSSVVMIILAHPRAFLREGRYFTVKLCEVSVISKQACPAVKRLSALPHILAPCAVPKSALRHMQRMLNDVLHGIPRFSRTPQFTVQPAVGWVSWSARLCLMPCLHPHSPKVQVNQFVNTSISLQLIRMATAVPVHPGLGHNPTV